jgi:hypothetical protein
LHCHDAAGAGQQAPRGSARFGHWGGDQPGHSVEVVVTTNTQMISGFEPPVIGNSGFQVFAFDQPTLGFADAGNAVTVIITSTSGFSDASDFMIAGYLLDCTVNQCAPIAP